MAKKKTVRRKRNAMGHFVKKDALEVNSGAGALEQKPEWELHAWSPDLIKIWSESPEFKSYCKDRGFQIDSGVSTLKTTTPLDGAINIHDMASVIAEAMARVNLQQQLPMVQPGNTGNDITDFPEPLTKEATTPDGKEFEISMPLYPINIAGRDYSGSGYYDSEVTGMLKEEIEGAEYVEIPYNAAFVEYIFHRTNDKGRIENIKEMFRGPGVFAGKTLAASLKKQISKLVKHTVTGGPDAPIIPGTKTQYNDLVTNDVLFVPGYTYLVPVHVGEDLDRRMKAHVESFQRVHQERISLGRQGGLSMYSGVQLQAVEAQARHDAGMMPSQIDKVVREGRV